MRANDVLERVNAKLTELGVPRHVVHVAKIPSKVQVQLFVRNSLWSLQLRRGITSIELEHKLDHLAAVWEHSHSSVQVDLEDAIKRAE